MRSEYLVRGGVLCEQHIVSSIPPSVPFSDHLLGCHDLCKEQVVTCKLRSYQKHLLPFLSAKTPVSRSQQIAGSLILDRNLQKRQYLDRNLQKRQYLDRNISQKRQYLDRNLQNRQYLDPNRSQEASF